MKILVTGASGFVGRRTLKPLQELGFQVHAIGRHDLRMRGVTFHWGNLLDPVSTAGVVDVVRPTHLLHCAWDVAHGKFWSAPENLDWVGATLLLARRFVECGGVRFVGVGTCAEYDWTHGVHTPRSEGERVVPDSLYGHAKLAASSLLQAFMRSQNVGFAWARLFHLFGPGERAERLIPVLARAVLKEEPARCGSRARLVDYLPVETAGAALAHIAASEVQGIVNVASGKPRPVSEFATLLAALAGRAAKAEEVIVENTNDSGIQMLADVSRLREEVRFLEGAELEESLRRTLDWWRTRC